MQSDPDLTACRPDTGWTLIPLSGLRKLTPERLTSSDGWFTLLVMALVGALGFLMVFRVPPTSGFDEPFHWRRAQQVATLGFLAPRLAANDWGGTLDGRAQAFEGALDEHVARGQPLSRREIETLARTLSTRPYEPVQVSFPSTASFAPLAYLPSATGIFVARRFHATLLTQFYAGRLAQLVVWMGLVALTIRVLPFGRKLALLLLTMPTQLHLAACFSADPMTATVPALYMALCLRLRLSGIRPPRGVLVAVFVLSGLTGLLKITDVVLALAVLLIPDRCFGRAWYAWLFRVGTVGVCVLTGVGWMLAYPFMPGLYWGTHPDPAAVLHLIWTHPFGATLRVGREMTDHAGFWWLDSYGRFGGAPSSYNVTFRRPGVVFAALLAMLMVLTVRPVVPHRTRIGLFLIVLGLLYAATLVGAFWIAYTPPDSATVMGLQGRYFILPELCALLGLFLLTPGLRVSALPAFRCRAVLALACLGVEVAVVVQVLRQYATLW